MEIIIRYIRNHRKSVIIVLLIILAFIGIVLTFKKINHNMPFEGNITSIRITQEIKSDSIEVGDISEFVKKMQMENWKEMEEFNLKSAPIYYLNLEPSGETIEIFMADEEYAYACFHSRYYLIPVEAYEYILDIISR